MELSNYDSFPQEIPLIIEDDIFLYPFMIAPLFLGETTNVKAVETAIDANKLVIVTVSKPSHEGKRDENSFYDVGVIGNIMRKVSLPDGKIKVLFQGLAKGKIEKFDPANPAFAYVDIIKTDAYEEQKVVSLIDVLREQIKKLSKINSKFPADLIKTIDENNDPVRIADLISSVLRVKKEEAYELFSQTNVEDRKSVV